MQNQTGSDDKNGNAVSLSFDMWKAWDAIVGMWGAMALEDNQLGLASQMAEALELVDEKGEVSKDQFFAIVKPFMAKIAFKDSHRRDFGLNRVLAVLYEGMLTNMAELGNNKEELLDEAKARYPDFEWEFLPPWECPKDHKEPEQFVWPEWLM